MGSPSSVMRAMARRGLLQPVRYKAERRQLAQAHREAFVEARAPRNLVWQADFTQFETGAESTWRLCPFGDYAIKVALACPVTLTQGVTEFLGALQGAAEALQGRPLIQNGVDPDTGEVIPLVAVTDNGSAMKSVAVACRFAAKAPLAHVRTRHRSPHTTGVVERLIESLKYECLYHHDIASGAELVDRVDAFIDEFNTVRPHQALIQTPPLTAYLQDKTLEPSPPRNERET